jgi:hypothetical protein
MTTQGGAAPHNQSNLDAPIAKKNKNIGMNSATGWLKKVIRVWTCTEGTVFDAVTNKKEMDIVIGLSCIQQPIQI